MSENPQISILLIDDNPRTRWEITAALLSVGFRANIVSADKQATHREILSGNQKFDVIIIDPFAFVGHGVEIVAELHAHPIAKYIPILVYSACGKKEWGGATCVTKPAHSAHIAGAILRLLPKEMLTVLSPVAARALAMASS